MLQGLYGDLEEKAILKLLTKTNSDGFSLNQQLVIDEHLYSCQGSLIIICHQA
jgi:hypothetical protein